MAQDMCGKFEGSTVSIKYPAIVIQIRVVLLQIRSRIPQ